jgi:hypothetical protein
LTRDRPAEAHEALEIADQHREEALDADGARGSRLSAPSASGQFHHAFARAEDAAELDPV